MINHRLTACLHARRDQAVFFGELVRHDFELTDRFGTGCELVGFVDNTFHFGAHDRIAGGLLEGCHAFRALRRKPCVRFAKIQRNDGRYERLAVADHHALAHHGRRHDRRFHFAWGDVLATGGDDEVLLASDDGDEAFVVDGTKITGMQPPVDDLLLGDVGIVVVAGAYGRALDAQFAFLVDAHGHALQR